MQQLDFTAQFGPRIILPDPWDFQEKAIEQLRQRLREEEEKGLVLSSPTGSGKTEIAKQMIAGAVLKGRRALFTVDGVDLLDQTSLRFYESGIEHGIWGAGRNRGRHDQIVVAMVQTLCKMSPEALLSFLQGFDVVFNDECQVIYRRLAEALPKLDIPHIGLTATPLARGLGRIYSGGLVNVATTNQLIKDGYLVPFVFRAATEINMDDAPVSSGGEWAAEEVRTRGQRVIGDIVSNWVEETNAHFGGPVKTMVFSASIAHGEELCREFQNAGYDFRQVTAHDTPDERKDTMAAFRHGEFTGVVSVAALGKGIDVPDVKCLVIARPLRKGFMAFIQMLGRGARTAPGKKYCLVVDNSGNVEGFYEDMAEFFEYGVSELDSRRWLKVTRNKKTKQDIRCAGCGVILSPAARTCPACGLERTRRSDVENVPGKMISIDPITAGKRGWTGTPEELWLECCTHAAHFLSRHNDPERAYRQAKANFRDLCGRWPSRDMRFVPKSSGTVSKPVQRKLDQAYRRWRKSRESGRV